MTPVHGFTPSVLAAALALAACGTTVIDEDDGSSAPGGSGGAGATASTSATATGAQASGPTGGATSSSAATSASGPSSSTGTSGCTAHEECPEGSLCLFSTGECAPPCSSESCDACTQGTVCDRCATSSGPETLDCVAACVPTSPGRCDDDDACAPGELCLFPAGFCVVECEGGVCADPTTACVPCGTGSCCGCRDCVDICMTPPD